MRRLAPLLVVLVLLGATAAAFAVTERLKLERSPIVAPEVTTVFSPVCECDSAEATIAFGLRKGDRVSLTIVDADGRVVRTLAEGVRASGRFERRWDGLDDAGVRVADGVYKPRLHLARGRRTFLLPKPIQVDTRPPSITLVSAKPQFFSPDGDRRRDRVRVQYRVSEKARAELLVNGVRAVGPTLRRPLAGKLDWSGTIGGRKQPQGLYRLQLSAEDPAGNLSARTKPVFVQLTYIALGRSTIRALARTRFGVRVTTDAGSFRWRFAGRTGAGEAGLLVLKAPKAGRYTLFVETNGHADKARVVVSPRPKTGRAAR